MFLLFTRFYTEVLDGMLIDDFRLRGGQEDFLQNQFFQKEMLDAQQRRVSAESLGVPDIRRGGRHAVGSCFRIAILYKYICITYSALQIWSVIFCKQIHFAIDTLVAIQKLH